MTLLPYSSEYAKIWNALVHDSKNGTFLINRRFMDYHSVRFEDCSLMFQEKGKIVACFPANICRETNTVYSHQGLTYGGLIMGQKITMRHVMEIFNLITEYYKERFGCTRIIYKPIPAIYSIYPAEEDLYALFRYGGKLISRGISSTIPLKSALPLSDSRKQMIKKSYKFSLSIEESTDVEPFWHILDNTLRNRHNAIPVHNVEELALLMERFPNNIKHFRIKNTNGETIAGTIIFICGRVIHTQYLAANEEGRRCSALDFLIHNLITEKFSKHDFFDFGISTEEGGKILNEGLIFQKEGFGARGICYDTYEINLS